MRADWYDRSINWAARLKREVPALVDVLGPPQGGGLLDAGCGTGHQALALAERGYRVVGADLSEEMLSIALRRAKDAPGDIRFVPAAYDRLRALAGTGFDGVYCLGNALAAAGSRDGVADALAEFAACLRPGGRLFVQVLNFAPMKEQVPCVRGPRVSTMDGQTYVSVRQFHFADGLAQVTNITLWDDGGWRKRAHAGTLYPVTLGELRTWCSSNGLRIDEAWGGYDRKPFDEGRSTDLIIAATRE